MKRIERNKIAGRRGIVLSKACARSRITNRKAILDEVDGRAIWSRRVRDLMSLYVRDAGGEDQLSEAQLSIIRRIAILTVELERLELRFASDEGTMAMLGEYQRCANTLRRLLQTLGIRRVARDITPSPLDYARSREARSS